MAFPEGSYTPFGYLRNPAHRASSWTTCQGGNLRSADDTLGVEWVYPWHNDPADGAGISLASWVGERRCVTRASFERIGYGSRYHTANVLGFDWAAGDVALAARAFLVDDVLCVLVEAANQSASPRPFRLGLVGRAWSRARRVRCGPAGSTAVFRVDGPGPALAAHALAVAAAPGTHVGPATPASGLAGEAWAEVETGRSLDGGERTWVLATLGRADDPAAALDAARAALPSAAGRLAALLDDDRRFWARCPVLAGDWPEGWREGLVYDFETTRLLVMPAGGIFRDVWPSWMVAWPRVVLAEGVLDMLRLAYGDPDLAQRAVLSLFRDAPAENVPCVFQDGSFNMVARDGSGCGTSPAWCLPFLNLELLYLRTLDRAWLAELYPFLARYLAWWLRYRTDGRGWLVYRCTWEAGEDGNPRLDPTGSGDADISAHVRPVELQATMAHAARVMALFASELGRPGDRQRWLRLRRAFARRTRRLFDPSAGRFRDWLIGARHFQEPRPDELYWGVDARRFSPMALAPLLDAATTAQARALRSEVARHCTPPWTWWPSWTYALVESAAAAGLRGLVGEVAWSVLERVYRENGRRTLEVWRRPTPGAAREYWPADLGGWRASDGYGWGATTANLLLRHVVGLQECRKTTGWWANLAPALPAALRLPGRRYEVRHLQYRGLALDLAYTWTGDGIEARINLDEPRACLVATGLGGGRVVYRSRRPAPSHTFRLANEAAYRLALPAPGQ